MWVLGSCAGSAPAADSAASTHSAELKLQGSWTLVSFTPDLALEPMLMELLSSQLEQLTIRFEEGSLVAQGPGVSLERRYEVLGAIGDDVSLSVESEEGSNRRFTAQILGDELVFQSLDAPWRGRGKLARDGS